MKTNEAIEKLILETDDHYTDTIRMFLLTIANLVSDDYLGTNKALNLDSHINKPIILTPTALLEIKKSYSGKLTKHEYRTRAFIANTYYLSPLNLDSPSQEWLWVSKLCQLLIYYAIHDLPQRIIETTTESRKWANPNNDTHKLWKKCYTSLQSNTLKNTYNNFADYKLKLERNHNPNLKSFRKIFRTIDFAYNSKSKITRSSAEKKWFKSRLDQPRTEFEMVENIDDDSDELVTVIDFKKSKNNNDINRERLDNPIPDYNFIKQRSVTKIERHSANQIYRRTQAKFAHANKNERFISSNIRQLPISAIQNICNLLWQWYINYENCEDDKVEKRELKRAIAYMILSLYTGYSVAQLAEDINQNRKQIINISRRKSEFEFIINLEITPLRIRTPGIKSVIANRVTTFSIPIPDSLGVFLTYKSYPSNSLINKVIARLRKHLELPLITLNRIERGLYNILIHKVASSQLASIVTSRNNNKRADLWYCSHSIEEIKKAYQQSIEILTKRCHDTNMVSGYLT